MRRHSRLLALLIVPVLLLGLTAGVAGASVIEDYARVIRSRHAGATFVQVDGCRQSEVFVSAMDGTFGARGGGSTSRAWSASSMPNETSASNRGPRATPSPTAPMA